MSTIRKNPLTNEWVIIAKNRTKRPGKGNYLECSISSFSDNLSSNSSNIDSSCPFCPGNEAMTPPEITSFHKEDSWWVRVVPNKYPVLTIEEQVGGAASFIYDTMGGFGAHEVIILSGHSDTLGQINNNQAEELFWILKQRSEDLDRDERVKYIQIFQNYGKAAGASLEHTHFQLVGLSIPPDKVRQETAELVRYREIHGRCKVCDIVDIEISLKERLVDCNASFIAICPFAPRQPYEIWIIPIKCQNYYHGINKTQVKDLASIANRVFKRIFKIKQNLNYNIIIHQAEFNNGNFHWHIEIIPRIAKLAGFEIGTGFEICYLPPEEAAKELKER